MKSIELIHTDICDLKFTLDYEIKMIQSYSGGEYVASFEELCNANNKIH